MAWACAMAGCTLSLEQHIGRSHQDQAEQDRRMRDRPRIRPVTIRPPLPPRDDGVAKDPC
jgi:hypothetical protein